MLYQDPELEAAEIKVLNQLRELQQQLRHNLQQSRKWTGRLARNLRASAIQGSNQIEGYLVSREDALAALDGDEPSDASEASWLAVLHYREAMDYVLRLSDASDFGYSKDLLRSLQYIMLRHEHRANPGLFRRAEIFVENFGTQERLYQGPAHERVPSLVEELVEDLSARDNNDSDRVIRAAMAHLNLVMIHPFSDGNGRMARCLQTLVLARGGMLDPTFSSIEEYLGQNTAAYYAVLSQVGGGSFQPERNARPWIRFCLAAHVRQATSIQRKLTTIANLGEAIEALLRKHGLPERAAPSLTNAALGDRLRNASYRRDADLSMNLASRDLKAIADAGLLEVQGDKRGRHYLASEELKSLAGQNRNTTPIPDPFDG